MLSRHIIWTQLEGLVQEAGMRLFDLDMPEFRSGQETGTLRIYIISANGVRGEVTHGDCARVSRAISSCPELDDLLRRCALEVSSPGVNRRLQRPEHFSEAVGERIRVTARDGQGRTATLSGVLRSFDGVLLIIEPDGGSAAQEVQFDKVQKARVDFLFDEA